MKRLMALLLAALLIPACAPAEVPDTKTDGEAAYAAGDTVLFGVYEQDNDTANGPEPIEWIVLEALEDRLLLISRYALDTQPYNGQRSTAKWEQCTLRAWLNGEFLTAAFGEAEQSAILTTAVDSGRLQGIGGFPGSGANRTEDRIFLLNRAEAWEYFRDDASRQCSPTAYAAARDANRDGEGNCWWWLCTPGAVPYSAAAVYMNGTECSYDVNRVGGAVRPALWMEIVSGTF